MGFQPHQHSSNASKSLILKLLYHNFSKNVVAAGRMPTPAYRLAWIYYITKSDIVKGFLKNFISNRD
jgi:hypothetical protein